MIYIWHHLTTLVLACCAAAVLARARWMHRSPGPAMLLWHATAFSALTGAVGLLLSVGLAPYNRGILPALQRFAADLAGGRLPPDLTPAHGLAVAAGVLLAGAAVAAQAWSSWEVHLRRSRHRFLLRLVARPDIRGRTVVLEHPAAAAYYVPGRHGCVVVSTGARQALTEDELAAVLAHEQAHARERHHLGLAPFHAVHRAVPCRVTARIRECVELLVEMRADDRAARDHGADTLVTALHRFRTAGGHAAPPGALAAADRALGLRIERLRTGPQPLAPHWCWPLAAAALTVATTPASLFVLPT